LCDNLFDILLENNFIKLFDHKVGPSPPELGDQKYCNWHNSFNHNTSDCNIFRQFIQSAIDSGRLRFAQTQGDDQLATIGFDDKGSLNRLASADLFKDPNLIAKEEDTELPSDEKYVVHDLQDQAIIENDELVEILEVNGDQMDFSPTNQEPIAAVVLGQAVRPPRRGGLTGLDQQVRPASQVGQTGSGLKD
jgi:hypothetical protein